MGFKDFEATYHSEHSLSLEPQTVHYTRCVTWETWSHHLRGKKLFSAGSWWDKDLPGWSADYCPSSEPQVWCNYKKWSTQVSGLHSVCVGTVLTPGYLSWCLMVVALVISIIWSLYRVALCYFLKSNLCMHIVPSFNILSVNPCLL